MVAGLALPAGCSSHLVYAERAHFGLHVNVKPDATDSPYEFDLGYRRAVVAFIPHEQANGNETTAAAAPPGTPSEAAKAPTAPTAEGEKKESAEPVAEGVPGDLDVVEDATEDSTEVAAESRSRNELMSLYTSFHGNIGFNDPIEYRHVLATGRAAKRLARNADALAALRARLEAPEADAPRGDDATKPAEPAKKEGGS